MAESLPRIIARQILHARVAKGWNQGELAAKARIPQATISRYESAERRGAHPENLIKIADATETSVDFLLGRELYEVARLLHQAEALIPIAQRSADIGTEILRLAEFVEN